eukprot:Em0002g876a
MLDEKWWTGLLHPSNPAIAADPLVTPASVKVVRLSGGLAGAQDNVDSKNPKMCQFLATTSMQSGIHQAQGEGLRPTEGMTDNQDAAWHEDTDNKLARLAGED